VTRKILLVLMLAATAIIVAEAIGQNPANQAQSGAAAAAPSLNPPANASTPPTTSQPTTSQPTTSQPPAKQAFTAPTPNPTAPPATASSTKTDATKSDPKADAAKSPTTSKTAPATSGKDAGAKDSSNSKTFSTSTSVPPAATSTTTPTSRELVLPRCLVTLKDDNKLPASEAGMLTEVNVKEGHTVEKDALVAVIDTRSTLAKQRIAAAEVAAATAQAENEAEIEVALAAIEVARAELQQSEEIRRTNARAVSESQWRKDKFNLDKSLAQEKQARNEHKIAGLTRNAKQAQLDAASIEIDLRQARSPFKGEVVEVMKQVGDWVTVGEPIMHIVGLDKVKVKGFVFVSGENAASQEEVIGKDVKIAVETAGGKKRTIAGKIGFASPVIEGVGTSRQFRVWAEVDNQKTVDPITKQEIWDLQPGSIATMTIDLAPPKPAAPAVTPNPSGKGKVESYKPVTGAPTKSTAKER
jgi:multidrug efflux pump subunit AcrA (membrane-fusion protein)